MLFLCSIGCSEKKPPCGPTPLMPPLRSKMVVEEVVKMIHVEGRYKLETYRPRRQPAELRTLRIDRYRHLGVDGKLVLDFFNDQLMECVFYPVDGRLFKEKLCRQLAATYFRDKLSEKYWLQKANVPPCTTIATQPGPTSHYVRWTCEELAKECRDRDD
jgi:hypothetical protein